MDHAQAARAASYFLATNDAGILATITRWMLMIQLKGWFIAIASNIGTAHYNPFWAREQKREGEQAKRSVLPHRFTNAFH